ncbi:uncharacterized protein ASCRUDRAFT_80703 [Ascoidea rubescens DSM 1968]|uniref:WD40 repeat-like protein n=1 Tax=Ascoidea rubescens DSM 1968 TaxID=1344418 RepID=A0A1D2VJ60_9ASCO|nr:hypothetical protein ASCRUDRAFT_80703 [Ascoidea rubescens DSM 1968]ODV61671.1 hypothetical protein ASCRUDRAFT_80703 [Ascoidea rubescens DSM 1968]
MDIISLLPNNTSIKRKRINISNISNNNQNIQISNNNTNDIDSTDFTHQNQNQYNDNISLKRAKKTVSNTLSNHLNIYCSSPSSSSSSFSSYSSFTSFSNPAFLSSSVLNPSNLFLYSSLSNSNFSSSWNNLIPLYSDLPSLKSYNLISYSANNSPNNTINNFKIKTFNNSPFIISANYDGLINIHSEINENTIILEHISKLKKNGKIFDINISSNDNFFLITQNNSLSFIDSKNKKILSSISTSSQTSSQNKIDLFLKSSINPKNQNIVSSINTNSILTYDIRLPSHKNSNHVHKLSSPFHPINSNVSDFKWLDDNKLLASCLNNNRLEMFDLRFNTNNSTTPIKSFQKFDNNIIINNDSLFSNHLEGVKKFEIDNNFIYLLTTKNHIKVFSLSQFYENSNNNNNNHNNQPIIDYSNLNYSIDSSNPNLNYDFTIINRKNNNKKLLCCISNNKDKCNYSYLPISDNYQGFEYINQALNNDTFKNNPNNNYNENYNENYNNNYSNYNNKRFDNIYKGSNNNLEDNCSGKFIDLHYNQYSNSVCVGFLQPDLFAFNNFNNFQNPFPDDDENDNININQNNLNNNTINNNTNNNFDNDSANSNNNDNINSTESTDNDIIFNGSGMSFANIENSTPLRKNIQYLKFSNTASQIN